MASRRKKYFWLLLLLLLLLFWYWWKHHKSPQVSTAAAAPVVAPPPTPVPAPAPPSSNDAQDPPVQAYVPPPTVTDSPTAGVSYYTMQGYAPGSRLTDPQEVFNLAAESKTFLNTYQPFGMPLYDQFVENYYKGGDTTELLAQINGAISDYVTDHGGSR